MLKPVLLDALLAPTMEPGLPSALAGAKRPPIPDWLRDRPALKARIAAAASLPSPHGSPVMADPPIITVGADVSAELPVQDHTYANRSDWIHYFGGADKDAGGLRQFPCVTVGETGGNVGGGRDAVVWRAGARLDAQVVAFQVSKSSRPYRFIVDGQYVSLDGVMSTAGPGVESFRIEFPTRAARNIFVEGTGDQAFSGILLAAPEDMQWEERPRWRMLAFGDGFVSGDGAAIAGDNLALVAGDLLGMDDVLTSGSAGTGYIADAGGTRYRGVDRSHFDWPGTGHTHIMVVAFGLEDLAGSTAAEFYAAAKDLLFRARGGKGEPQMVIVGPWDPTAPAAPSAKHIEFRDTLKALVEQELGDAYGCLFLDPTGLAYTKSDGVLPDTAGHATLGTWLANQIRAWLGL
ncbi:hypothetical protein [Bordetella phage vB_BbrM_PHB04]|uniref:Uncharacterized protein n=1 Tax=Bordetella phage vB_BbrM_PHB04 TaxID=2029657 RepID=A0A291LA55_9CAUD|nr:hydrolase [Bordetella phage vB_BbrM_PHB04]ATI15683.1 hypothetical protein [Bordetella phage vB_BbrM_PHB04]